MKVLWACDEMGVPYEREDIGGPFGGNDTPEYRAKNPMGLVPTIEHDGFVLWESQAIVRYLAGLYGQGTLCAGDPRQRADRTRVVTGKGGSGRVDLGGRRTIQKKTRTQTKTTIL